MKKQLVMAVAATILAGLVQAANAASPPPEIQSAFDALKNDFTQASEWINKQQSKSVAFLSGGSINRPANVKSLPGFEIGVTGGLSVAIDPEMITDISTYAVSSDFLALPAFFFTPSGMIYAKVGLIELPVVGRIDLGAAFSNYQIGLTDQFEGEFSQWQLEGRMQLLPDKLTSPVAMSLTVGVGNAKGNFTVQHKHSEVINSIIYDGNTYDQTLDIVAYMSSDWDVTSYYAKLMISKNLVIITPYVGLGLQAAAGNVNTVVGATGEIILDPEMPGPDSTGTVGIRGPASASPSGFDWRLIGGAQLNLLPFISLNITGEYGQNVYAGNAGIIVSFL